MKFFITREKIKISTKELKRYFKFLFLGIPSILISILLNIFLVEVLVIEKSLSYCLITFLQILINFFLIKKYIFNSKKNKSQVISFLQYFFGILIIRTLDLLIYSKIINYFPDFYIGIQILNATIFSMIKFKYLKFFMD